MIEAEALEINDERRPYAPAANITAVMERVRRINLPDLIDTDFLRVTAIPEASLGRVAYALRFLRLIEANGRPSDRLRAMARASEDEYRELLEAVVREAYAPDLARVDPSLDTQAQIVSAFQRYEPRSQTMRMVMLFLGLCRAAGIPVLESPRERQMQNRRAERIPRAPRAGRSTTVAPHRPTVREVEAIRPPISEGLLFSVTVEDIGALDDADFDGVWTALGKVARARARARDRHGAPASPAGDDQEGLTE